MSLISKPKTFCLFAWGAAAVLVLTLLGGTLIPWLSKNADLNRRISGTEDQLVRYQRLLDSRPALEAELQRVRNNDSYKAFYFNAPTQSLAGAQLQSLVQDIVNTAQGRLISTQLLNEERASTPARISVRTQIRGSTDALLSILYQIEQARPFLFVERLSIRSSARPIVVNRNRPGRPVRRPPMNRDELTVRLDLFGFTLGGES
ncbi:General secretion pathway protein M [Thiorhodococcus drewsii AZ1]|uniref:General secretion pathway protein M n=1 Tax=Thiorhodococcus drewsii AZ1 TaxID=765913 RepID=G2E1M1_9GAMM|nr:type II secretion system protein GspM [Thiorhodococcus drewsii]EGV31318.1 General secretion pathway protein M [Thiorhodococcus drewsii AZ1]